MKPFELDLPSDKRAVYDGRIHSAEWAETREEVMLRDGSRCRICGCPHDLQVHHISYDDFLDEDNLVTLCKPCHEIITEAVNKARKMEVSVDMPKTISAWNWKEEEARFMRTFESALYHGYREIVADAILKLWKRTLKDDSIVNLKQLEAMQMAGSIITGSIEGQTGLHGFGEVHYVSVAIDRITEYTAKAYDHYASEGMSDSEFARMFRIQPDKMWKVKRNAEKIRSGGVNGE